MTKQKTSIQSFRVEAKNGVVYIVLLERLSNTTSGNPRFSAVLIPEGRPAGFNPRFTFHGHYYNDAGEAKYIVDHYTDILEDRLTAALEK